MKVKGYGGIEVSLLSATENPLEILGNAINITMKKDFNSKIGKDTLKNILEMNHTSIFEHINYSFLIKGASRSFLAQITRHRMASFPSGSQHYQDYSDYECRVDDFLIDNPIMKDGLESAMSSYKRMLKDGVPNYEARQVLPNAMENNLMVTMNARGLINFMNLRLCSRNTNEIKVVSMKMKFHLLNHLPELWNYVGPDCYMTKCKQKHLKCDRPYNLVNEK